MNRKQHGRHEINIRISEQTSGEWTIVYEFGRFGRFVIHGKPTLGAAVSSSVRFITAYRLAVGRAVVIRASRPKRDITMYYPRPEVES